MLNKRYRRVLAYIEEYWPRITFYTPKTGVCVIGLPRPYVAPNHLYFAKNLFYWDSYFTILGLVVSRRTTLAKDIVEDLIYLLERFGIILARNRWYSLARTQPPLLTQMAFEIYQKENDLGWLTKVTGAAKKEYHRVWHNSGRLIKSVGLNRYYPVVPSSYLAEHESGWDMTSRFGGECRNVIPVDLNCLLYQYESDFAQLAKLNNDIEEQEFWLKKAALRRDLVNGLLWDDGEEFFYDFNFTKGKRLKLKTLAAYYPLWCGLASRKQAESLVHKLPVFEESGGLANTEKVISYKKQWDWPQGWPNQQWIVIKGLLNYGFINEAGRLAYKWLELNQEVFERTGRLWEKYDVVKRDIGQNGLYLTQEGFGWTNGVFLRLLSEFSSENQF